MPKFNKAYFEIRSIKLGFGAIKLIFNLAIMPNPWDSGKLPKSCIGLPRRISKYALLNFGKRFASDLQGFQEMSPKIFFARSARDALN